jgi:hypothetical protein
VIPGIPESVGIPSTSGFGTHSCILGIGEDCGILDRNATVTETSQPIAGMGRNKMYSLLIRNDIISFHVVKIHSGQLTVHQDAFVEK